MLGLLPQPSSWTADEQDRIAQARRAWVPSAGMSCPMRAVVSHLSPTSKAHLGVDLPPEGAEC